MQAQATFIWRGSETPRRSREGTAELTRFQLACRYAPAHHTSMSNLGQSMTRFDQEVPSQVSATQANAKYTSASHTSIQDESGCPPVTHHRKGPQHQCRRHRQHMEAHGSRQLMGCSQLVPPPRGAARPWQRWRESKTGAKLGEGGKVDPTCPPGAGHAG